MIYLDQEELKARIKQIHGRNMKLPIDIITDTTDFMSLERDTVIRLGDNDYVVRGHRSEDRFGIEDQPKFWVKNIMDLTTGERKILKLVFYEDFTCRNGPFLLKGYRSPEKESQVLDIVKNNPYFMQGISARDNRGNLIRIIDIVRGTNLYNYILRLYDNHESYFFKTLPGILTRLIDTFEAMNALRDKGMQHGDIRTDHLIMEKESGRYVWIDFDCHVGHSDYDIWCMGNVLNFVVGKGTPSIGDLKYYPERYPGTRHGLTIEPDDMLMVTPNRIANLKKLYPYIPTKLNSILTNFSTGTKVFYDSIDAFLVDLRDAMTVFKTTG